MPPRPIDLIVVHCSATPQTMDIGEAEIRLWHMRDNGWADIGYHFIIRRNGTVETGRPEDRIGAHTRGHNDRSLGICLVGGNDANNKLVAEFNYTRAQMASLETLLTLLTSKHPGAKVRGHRDYDSKKACPVFDVQAWWGGP